jgi:hypothetical protein
MGKDFRKEYKSFSTPKLIVIAAAGTWEYRAEAIEAARTELESRGKGETWKDAEAVLEARIATGAIGDIDDSRRK